jgi:hypothetical protein
VERIESGSHGVRTRRIVVVTVDHPAREPEGGDPVCWMHLLCPSCGAMPEAPDDGEAASPTCPRCGEELPR